MVITIISFGFSLILHVKVAFSVACNLNSKQIPNSASAVTVVIKRTTQLEVETILRPVENSLWDKVLVKSLDSYALVALGLTVGVESLQRNKRKAITGNEGSGGMWWIANLFVKLEKYKVFKRMKRTSN